MPRPPKANTVNADETPFDKIMTRTILALLLAWLFVRRVLGWFA